MFTLEEIRRGLPAPGSFCKCCTAM